MELIGEIQHSKRGPEEHSRDFLATGSAASSRTTNMIISRRTTLRRNSQLLATMKIFRGLNDQNEGDLTAHYHTLFSLIR